MDCAENIPKVIFFFDSGTSQEEDVKAGWAKVGVDFHYHSGRGSFSTHNEYYISGNKVSRKEAHLHALLQLSPMAQQIWEAIKSK